MSDDNKDDKLNPLSTKFDPLIALYSSQVNLPIPNAPVLDNLSRFEATTSGITVKTIKKKAPEPPKPTVTLSTNEQSIDGWDNVITRMRQIEGPLALLRDCIERKVQIKVYTRNESGVRGYLIGFVIAFDKMWNLAMEDVTEVWTRKRKKKTPAMGGVSRDVLTKDHPSRMSKPQLKITKINKSTEKCERRVYKIFVRGEHVVIINVLT